MSCCNNYSRPRPVCLPISCPPPANSAVEKVGVYPYLVAPLHNYETLIMYVDIYFPGSVNPRRAWLMPPCAEGDKATVVLETTRMNLGQDGAAPRVNFQTSLVPAGDWVYPGMGALLQTESVTGSYVFGLTEDEKGNLTAAAPPKTIIPPNVSSFEFAPVVTIAGTIVNPTAPLQTGVRNNVFTSDNRELRAIPVGAKAAKSTCRRTPEPTFSAYGYEFYLGWREPASNEGYPANITFVTQLLSIPCNVGAETGGPPFLRDPTNTNCCSPVSVEINPQFSTGRRGTQRTVVRSNARRHSAFAGNPGYFNYHR